MTLALLITAATGAWAADYYVVGNFTNWSTNPAYKMTLNTECTSTTEYILTLDLAADAQFKVVKDDGQVQTWYPDGMGNNYGENGELKGAGKYTVYFRPNEDGNEDWFYGVINIAAAESAPASIITVNDAKTEATFLMPAFNATAEYVIVRNMGSEDVTVQVGDGTVEQPRFRVRKKEQGEGYEAVEYTSLEQIAALISVYDAVEEKTLTPQQDFYVKFYKIDEQTGQPLSADGVELADFDFAPGLYAVKAIAQDDSEDYGGETGFSNLFQLVEKVDLTFDPAPVVNMTVTTKEGEADPVEATAEQLEAGKIEQLEPGTEVKLKAKKGYKFIKVVAKEEE